MLDRTNGFAYINKEIIEICDNLQRQIEDVVAKKKSSYDLIDFAEEIYWLKKLNHPFADTFINLCPDLDFSDSDFCFDDPQLLYYLYKLGKGDTLQFKTAYECTILERQTRKGYIQANYLDHVGPLSVLVIVDPNSEETDLAIEYLITCKLKDYKESANKNDRHFYYYIKEIATAILSLFECNYYKYSSIIDELCLLIKQYLNREIYVKDYSGHSYFSDTCLALEAISLIYGSDDCDVKNTLQWIKNYSDSINRLEKCKLLSVLVNVDNAVGIPYKEYEKLATLSSQQNKIVKSHLVSTIPFEGNFSIKTKIKEMLTPRHSRIWICSRFITEFWTDIINLKRDHPSIDIKILTIPQSEAKSKCMGDGKKFVTSALDSLEKTLKADFKTSDILHARFVITDSEVLISSADFSSEQLEKEFNLGVWTTDKEIREQCVDIFQRYWNNLS